MATDNEPGDDYIRRIAAYIRTHEQQLAAAALPRRRRAAPEAGPSIFNPLGWFATDSTAAPTHAKPAVLSFDVHHLYYLLMRMEALGLPVGSLDVQVENPSRAMNYISIPGADNSDTMSLRSFASTLSAVSKLSLGGGWWGRPTPLTVDAELRYIYSSFTILPAIRLHAPESHMIAELAKEPLMHALPMEALKNLETLETQDVDPRVILGWDRLAESLRSLSIRRSGLEDIGDVFVDAVLDDQARREGRSIMPRSGTEAARRGSFHITRLPDSVPEDSEEAPTHDSPTEEDHPDDAMPTPRPSETSLKWAFLRHLSLAENALTFVASVPLQHLTSVTHLDLSSNLLVSIPSGLSALYNLVSLNLSDNMIDSVLGIYTMLGGILTLNLSRNRLESICGLERLLALERVDLRNNLIEESAEVGRLATLPNIAEVWVESNPLTELEEGYRIRCFDIFWKEGKSILLDGSQPSMYEKQYLTTAPPEQMTSTRPASSTAAYSPPAVPIGGSPRSNGIAALSAAQPSPGISPATSTPGSHSASPQLAGVGARGRRRKNKRIVELDGSSDMGSSRSASRALDAESPPKRARELSDIAPLDVGPSVAAFAAPRPPAKFVSRPALGHARRQTEFSPPATSPLASNGKAPSVRGAPLQLAVADAGSTLGHRRSATVSSKSAKRRARVSASMYEPPTPGAGAGVEKEGNEFGEAEAFRARIEALRSDMGEGWLKVFNQSHLNSPSPPPAKVSSG